MRHTLAVILKRTLANSLVIAFFLTMVLGLNESVSAQSMTVTIQALRSARVTWKWFLEFRRELVTAALLGLACGAVVFMIVWIWRHDDRRFGRRRQHCGFAGHAPACSVWPCRRFCIDSSSIRRLPPVRSRSRWLISSRSLSISPGRGWFLDEAITEIFESLRNIRKSGNKSSQY